MHSLVSMGFIYIFLCFEAFFGFHYAKFIDLVSYLGINLPKYLYVNI
jgi:hypothetical protein